MSKIQGITVYRHCEIRAVRQGHQWQVWFRTMRHAQKNLEFRPFASDLFDDPETAVSHFTAFLDASTKTPWLFTQSGKFLGRSLESWEA